MTDEAMTPLRRRMIDEMTIRHFEPKTQQQYIRAVKSFADFFVSIGAVKGPPIGV